MGKETKVGLLVGMCFIVCCAIVLSHHGRRRAEVQDLSATNAQKSREAPLLLDRNASAERATERNQPKRTHRRKPTQRSRTHREDAGTQLADAGSVLGSAGNSDQRESQTSRFGFGRPTTETSAAPQNAPVASPFIHRGPPIPDVVQPKSPLQGRTSEERIVRLDDETDNDPMVANLPRTNSSDSSRRTLTSTPSPTTAAEKNSRETGAYPTASTRELRDRFNEARERLESQRSEKSQRSTKSNAPAAMDRHVVQEGENLSRIAEQYYGSSATHILDAIVNANGATMSGPNHIVSGKVILIPEISGVEAIRQNESHADVGSGSMRSVDQDDVEESRRQTRESVPDNIEPEVPAEYEVQSGDLLSRIVARQYGSSSKEIVDAVFEANRDKMKSPDELVAGKMIVLPVVDGIRPKANRSSNRNAEKPKREEKAKRDRGESEDAFHWYQVKKGDTYSTIAAAQMGSSRHWKQLADFNKNIFANAKQIRHGVRIRIPSVDRSHDKSNANRRGR